MSRRRLLRRAVLSVAGFCAAVLLFDGGRAMAEDASQLPGAVTRHPLYNGLLEIDIPAEYEELRLRDMERTFPSLPLPEYVYADRLRTSLIAVSIVNNPNPDVDMLTYTATWAKSLETALPQFNWVQRRVARIEGRPWIVWQYHSLTPDGINRKVTSETLMFMSILSKDVMVMLLGQAPRAIFAQNVPYYQAAVESLNLSIDAPQLSGLQSLGVK